MPLPRLPRTVWMLGLVSLFMDMSSEFIHAVLPIYLTTTHSGFPSWRLGLWRALPRPRPPL